MEITFIRHAEKESVGEDPFLTKKGIKQAKYLAKKLKKDKFNEFYCSDMNRAKQTAKIISNKIGLKPKIEESLNEFNAVTIKKNKGKWDKKERTHYNSLISFLKKITKKPNGEKSVLIVAHGITNRVILSYLLNIKINNVMPFVQKETGINLVSWMEQFKNWRVISWNDHHHVPKRLKQT
jgi:broad specificity phosphatase PhoE